MRLFLVQSREEFCQLVQVLKNRHSNETDSHTQKVSVFIGTFNMGEVCFSLVEDENEEEMK
jgi:hypothetical protein